MTEAQADRIINLLGIISMELAIVAGLLLGTGIGLVLGLVIFS